LSLSLATANREFTVVEGDTGAAVERFWARQE